MHWLETANKSVPNRRGWKRTVWDWPTAAIQLKWSIGITEEGLDNRFWIFNVLAKSFVRSVLFPKKAVQFQNWFETPRLLHAPGFINFLPEFLSKLTETFLRQICGFASQGFIPSLPKLLSRKSTLASALFPNSTDSPLYLRYLQTNCKV